MSPPKPRVTRLKGVHAGMVLVQTSIEELDMRMVAKYLAFVLVLATWILGGVSIGYTQLASRQQAPVFSLKDTSGKTYDLSLMKERTLIILYFFDVESRPSQEGLLTLNQLAREHKYSDLTVLAITLSSKDKATRSSSLSLYTTGVMSSSLTM